MSPNLPRDGGGAIWGSKRSRSNTHEGMRYLRPRHIHAASSVWRNLTPLSVSTGVISRTGWRVMAVIVMPRCPNTNALTRESILRATIRMR